jgi:hypothetical protein
MTPLLHIPIHLWHHFFTFQNSNAAAQQCNVFCVQHWVRKKTIMVQIQGKHPNSFGLVIYSLYSTNRFLTNVNLNCYDFKIVQSVKLMLSSSMNNTHGKSWKTQMGFHYLYLLLGVASSLEPNWTHTSEGGSFSTVRGASEVWFVRVTGVEPLGSA